MTAQRHTLPDVSPVVCAPTDPMIYGQGEMVQLVRSFNWADTSLGPIEHWPASLLTVVNLMLASPTPAAIYWGTERVLLYNDHFQPFVGEQHPACLGAPGPLLWKNSWHLLREQCDAVFAAGAIAEENSLVPLERDGDLEDGYWTYSLIPIYERGEVAGIFHATRNTTRDPDNKRREVIRSQAAVDRERIVAQELLVKLLQWQREATDPRTVMHAAAEVVGYHLKADRTGFFDMVDDDTLHLTACWTAGELPVLEGEISTGYLGAALLQESRLGLTHAIRDYITDPRTADADFSAIGIRSGIGVPIIRRSRWQSGFYVHCTQPREWSETEISFVREVAIQTLEGVELIRAQLVVRQSEARLRKILQSIGDAVIVADADNIITGINPVAEQLTGWKEEEARGHLLVEVFRAKCGNGPWEMTETISQAILLRRDGKEVPIEQSGSLMLDAQGNWSGTVLIFRDITERETTERRVRQGFKMEALGQLTGGIAHDFNNILAIIMGNLDLISEELEAGHTAHERIAQALASTERAADLTRRLLAFARQQPLTPVLIDVAHLVQTSAEFIRRSLGPSIALQVDIDEGLWAARIDRSQFENALLNLAVNARDAMPNGGQLRIGCGNHVIEGGTCSSSEIAPGEYLRISVKDTGHGMSSESRLRATEPFFTTKAVGEGTGLGLSMVYGFLKQSGGHLQIESELATGTTVALFLPRAAFTAQKPAVPRLRPSPEPLPRGVELVLVVEDELAIRRTIAYLLTSLGYRVLEAEDGPTAMLHLERTQTPRIDLLLTDVILPNGMSGPDLARKAALLQPEMAMIFTSGYTSNVLIRDYGLQEGMHLLNKPFPLAELANMLRRVLNERLRVSNER